MSTTLILSIPSLVNSTNACASASLENVQDTIQFSLPDLQLYEQEDQIQYSLDSTFNLNGELYTIFLELSVINRQISGKVSISDNRGYKAIDSILHPKATNHPRLPIIHRWDNIRILGQQHTAIIDLYDIRPFNGTTLTNTGIAASLEGEVIYNNISTTFDSAPVELRGDDSVGWSIVQPFKMVMIVPDPGTAISVSVDSLTVYLKFGIITLVGSATFSLDRIGQTTKNYSTKFYAPETAALYNIQFPWTNTFNLYDNNSREGMVDKVPIINYASPTGIISNIRILGKNEFSNV